MHYRPAVQRHDQETNFWILKWLANLGQREHFQEKISEYQKLHYLTQVLTKIQMTNYHNFTG